MPIFRAPHPRYLFAALIAVGAGLHCSDSDPAAPPTTSEPAKTGSYVGVFAAPDRIGTLELEIGTGVSLAAAGAPSGSSIGGRIRIGDEQILVNGTLTDTAFTLTGGGWTVTGQLAGGVVTGSVTGPFGTFPFSLRTGGSAIQVFCGTYTGARSGVLGVASVGAFAAGAVAGADLSPSVMLGTTSGSAIALSGFPPSGSVNGTVSGTSLSGTWDDGSGRTGTFAASRGACPTGRPAGVGGAGGQAQGGSAGQTQGGAGGGSAGQAQGGAAGQSQGGAGGGSAGQTQGGAGGGSAGQTQGGAGGGSAGQTQGGAAGQSQGGAAGEAAAGAAGADAAGAGGAAGACNAVSHHPNATPINDTKASGSDNTEYKGSHVELGTYILTARQLGAMAVSAPATGVVGTMVLTALPADPQQPDVQVVHYERLIQVQQLEPTRESGTLRFGLPGPFDPTKKTYMEGEWSCLTPEDGFISPWKNEYSAATYELYVKWRANSNIYGPKESWIRQP